MSLSIVGRTLLPHQPIIPPIQDPDNLDKFYYLANDLKVYSITWPDAPVLLADTSALLAGKTIGRMSTIAKNASSLFGMLDETYHFAFAFRTTSIATTFGILDVNTVTGAYSVCYPFPAVTGADGAMWDGYIYSRYTDSDHGTLFYTVVQHITLGYNYVQWGGKYYGITTGYYGPAVDATAPAIREPSFIDEINQKIFNARGSGQAWYETPMGSFTPNTLPLTADVLPRAGVVYIDSSYGAPQYYYPSWPTIRRAWDDNWVYGFAGGQVGGSFTVLWYWRKNVITGQYQVGVFTGIGFSGTSGSSDQAFDIWQPGTDESKRRIFFSFTLSRRVYTSLAWPPVVSDSIEVDIGGSTNVYTVHTANEYVYAFHTGGTNYGNCLTKILETELVAGAAEPSIGGIGARLLFKDKRVFFIGVPGYGKYLWWGQPMEPQALDVGWDGFNTTVFDDEDNTSLNALDDSIYVGSQKGFIRLRGKSPDSWVLDQTLATQGPLSDKTASVTPFGLIYPRENGLWLFNGFTSTLFFEKGKNLLNNVNWDQYARAFSLWDGRYYRLYYPSGTAIENDRELVIDLIGGIENARGTEGDRAATFGFADLTTNTVYLGDASGNLMTLGGTAASRPFSLTTKEYPCGAGLMEAGSFSALHYDIDLAGATLSIIPICDGVEKTAITITNTTRTRSKVSLPKGNFYRMGFRFEVTTAAAVKFYDPWYVE